MTAAKSPLPEHGKPFLLADRFAGSSLRMIRHATAEHAESLGLNGPRLLEFVLAVHESVANVVKHAGNHGEIQLWRSDGHVHCTISDRGPGIPLDGLNVSRISPDALGGRGLWLIHHLVSSVDITTGEEGTVIHLAVELPAEGTGMKRIRTSPPLRETEFRTEWTR
ncbi:ATP-binding protein [Nonomuraea sp. NPDC050394]|uniref:ATP-binding protein n=1 Tax=Nonomuraea sp. NPDC050394 TaxID=3364363 RepID=UPI0037951A4F